MDLCIIPSNMDTTSPESHALLLLDVAARIERRLDAMLSMTRGISFSEYRILKALAAAHGAGIMRVALADKVGLTASAVTRALRPLEKIGLVTTGKHERDARRSLAKLTAAGAGLLDDATTIVAEGLDGLPLEAIQTDSLSHLRAVLSKP